MSLTEQIRHKARALGFTSVGFAPADPLKGAEFYARWVALGYAGQMDYLKRHLDKREDPRRMVPGAQTAICLGMDYYQPTHAAPDPLRGQIACYARGDDYHDIVKKRLAALWEFVLAEAGEQTKGRYFVDTAPVLERELAQRAGLGWWGKNTCLIDKRRGSYFFLAEIITDLELDYDEPAQTTAAPARAAWTPALPTPSPSRTCSTLSAASPISTLNSRGRFPATCAKAWASGYLAATFVKRCARGTARPSQP